MASAMRVLHYPKAGALKTVCQPSGAGFRCKSTYRHHRIRRFYAGWAAGGGYICAGTTQAVCTILKHGFMSNSVVAGNTEGAAQQAARGYMQLHYDAPDPYVAPDCVQPGQPATWSFCYWATDTARVNVTVHLARVRPGYVTTVAAANY